MLKAYAFRDFVNIPRTTDGTGKLLEKPRGTGPFKGTVKVEIGSKNFSIVQVSFPVFDNKGELVIGDCKETMGDNIVETLKELALRAWHSGSCEQVLEGGAA